MRVNKIRRRQVVIALVILIVGAAIWASQISQPEPQTIQTSTQRELFGASNARAELEKIEVKGRAPKPPVPKPHHHSPTI
jgi:hypothetical protein